MATIPLPAIISGRPRKFEKTDFDSGDVIPGKFSFRHQLLINGEAFKFYADEDFTASFNGQGDALDSGDPVKVTAELDVFPYSSGKPGLKLSGLTLRK